MLTRPVENVILGKNKLKGKEGKGKGTVIHVIIEI